MRPKVKKLILFAPLAIVAMTAFAFLGGEIVKLLWNWLLPPLFGWRLITFWQALGVLVLCRILFGRIGGRGYGGGGMRRRMQERMEERCANATPEEREKFRQRMRERWGFGPPAGESKTP